MAVKFTEKQWGRMIEAVTKKFGEESNVSEVLSFIAEYKAPRASRATKPSGAKRVPNAYVLWTKDNRTKIVEDHFGGVNPKASEVTKKASTIWNSLSEEEKKPWVEKSASLKEEAGQSPCSSPSSSWKFEKKVDVEVPEGWSGPFEGKYLARYAAKGRGVGRFATFEEAVEAANALGNKCGGITLEQKAYTLRVGNDPIRHENPSQSSYSAASWTKNDFEPDTAESPKPKKKAEANEEPKAESKEEANAEDNVYDNETEAEDEEEETEVERWTFKGKIYLLDPTTDEVYDASSCELLGKKGEGEFAEESPKKIVVKKN